MKSLRNCNVLVTGATGGIGVHICHALAAEGANLALVSCPGTDLTDLAAQLQAKGVRIIAHPVDIRIAEERQRMVDWIQAELGPIDVLVNNAGVEFTSPYHELTASQINEVLQVNLEAPMLLSHAVLPGMVKRRCGHIVNISSLAGKSGPACQESYSATKAGLVGFTFSLRATYRGSGVSASVICPGFVEAGIYSRIKETAGRPAPPLLAATGPEKVARAVVKAIISDKAEIIVNRYPIRPVLALNSLSPAFAAWFTEATGANEFFRTAARRAKKSAS